MVAVSIIGMDFFHILIYVSEKKDCLVLRLLRYGVFIAPLPRNSCH